MNPLEATFSVLATCNLDRMMYLAKSRPSSKLGHVGSKCRSLGQIFETACELSRGHIFSYINLKLGHKDGLDKIWHKFEIGPCGVKK